MSTKTMSIGRRLAASVQKLFANPWALWALLTALGTAAAFLTMLGKDSLSASRVAVGGVFGCAVGAAYVVEVRCMVPIFLNRLICALIGALAGFVIGLLLSFSITGTLISVALGLLLGATSRNWISQVNLP